MRLPLLGLSLTWSLVLSSVTAEETLNFNRDVRPILSAKCFACHGPDGQDRDADYRLDTEDGAFADLGGYAAIVPGKPEESELFHRITSDDEDDLMPPPKHKNPLTPEEVTTLTRWIEEGAPYAGHWAFQPVQRPEPPEVAVQTANPIDQFIAARLEKESLGFSPEAPPETLVRRLHLDLTGLPPTPAQIDSFLRDPEKEFAATVDRLMESPQFAERLALEWLDVARFADTNGYSIDDHRDMWAWRDWVIHTFMNNLPFDEFLRQQLAGDLMPGATEPQKIATGFLRNAMNTHEGGTIPEEYKVTRIADQIDTVSTAFMGLTMQCAQCHDHKYDPISQRDYYRFFAFFNTSAEPGLGKGGGGNTPPILEINPLLQDKTQFRRTMEGRIAELQHLKDHPEPFLGDARRRWEHATLAKAGPEAPAARLETAASFPFPNNDEANDLAWIWSNPAGKGEFAWFRKTFTLKTVPEHAQILVSCDNEAQIFVNGELVGDNPDWRTPSILDIRPQLVEGENLIAVAAKDWEGGKHKAALVALAALSDGTYIGTDASWLVGTAEQPKWKLAGNPEGFAAASVVARYDDSPWGDLFAKFRGNKQTLATALGKTDQQRSQKERNLVTAAFAKASPDMSKLAKAIDGEIGLQRKSLVTGKTTVMVMDQGAPDRKTPILIRGAYDQPGEIVDAGIPGILGALPESTVPPDRLALANWLTDPAHPLTARVTVNRYWQMLFGTGLVKTAEDFGSQGEWPSHPELLDWLASEFVTSGWDVRALLKTMLISRTYRQASDVSESLLERDPYNRLLARAPRFRLPAESIRDGALAIGGLLKQAVGGPSVYPPQPAGLWKEVSHFGHPNFFSSQHFFSDRDPGRIYRRSLYSFWKRTSPPPIMVAFDAPNRETCSVRRSLTNTPLQALVLMNEPQFLQAAHGLATRMQQVEGEVIEQIHHGFRLATARHPEAEEIGILKSAYERQLAYFGGSTEHTTLFLNGSDKPEAAAMATVASLILNLDETITRE